MATRETMHEMCRLDYIVIANELKALEGSFFNKAFWHNNNVFRIKTNKGNITFSLGKWIMAENPETEAKEHPFASVLRKELDNQYLDKVDVVNGDRLVVLKFRTASLCIEMFGKAKAVLVGSDGKVICFFVKDGKEKMEIGQEYRVPGTMPIDARPHIEKAGPGKPIGALLARMVGKFYSKYMLEKEGISESSAEYGENGLDAIATKYAEEAKPYLMNDLSDYAALPVSEGMGPAESLSFAIKACLGAEHKENPELEKLKKSRERIAESIIECGRRAEEAKEIGEFIYANYEETENAIHHAKRMEDDAFLKARKAVFDKKGKSVELDLGEQQG